MSLDLDAPPVDPAEPTGSLEPDGSGDNAFLSWAAIIFAIAAIVVAFLALGRIGGGDDGGSAADVQTTTLKLELGGMVLVPDHLMAPPGRIIVEVENTDTMVHNVTIGDKHLADLQPGESGVLDLGVMSAGNYEMWCEIAGHAAAGMTGTLMVAEGADPGDAGTSTGPDYLHGYNTAEEMQAAMDARANEFLPNQETTEFGGDPLEWTMSDDGYKTFEVTAAITDWEVEPGQIVQAWTYNGTVPAPHMHAEVGDMVRVILHNELPVGTVIHWHGIRVPADMDGVPPFTQPAVMPGETFVYEFEALEPAVGIYHSHNGASQVLDGLFGAFTIGQMQTPQVLLDDGFKAEPDQTINMVLNDAGVIGLTLNGKSFPSTESYFGKVGDTVMVHYYNEGLMPHPMHLHQPIGWIIAKDGKELLDPLPGDTINVAPGERYTVLYKLTDPGVWAWHCHILTHAERDDGMFGMVTAFIVEE